MQYLREVKKGIETFLFREEKEENSKGEWDNKNHSLFHFILFHKDYFMMYKNNKCV